MKKVAVIVVTYNGSKWVNRCFGSLRDPEFPVKVIAVDNGSSDGTPEQISEAFGEVQLVRTQKNLGFGQANNLGIRLALAGGADYVFLLNQDAWVEKGTLSKLVETAEKHPDYGIVSPVHLTGPGDKPDRQFLVYSSEEKCPGLISDQLSGRQLREVYSTSFVNAAAWLVSKACLEKTGGFDPVFFMYGEDDDYLNRVFYRGLKVGIVPGIYIHHDREERKTSISQVAYLKKYLLKTQTVTLVNPNLPAAPGRYMGKLLMQIFRHLIFLRVRYLAASLSVWLILWKKRKSFRDSKNAKLTGKSFLFLQPEAEVSAKEGLRI